MRIRRERNSVSCMGPALAPFALAVGPLAAVQTPLGSSGLIGTAPAFADIVLVLNGYSDPAWRLTDTYPGTTVGTAGLVVDIPPALAGAHISFQGLVGSSPSTTYLTAAHAVSF